MFDCGLFLPSYISSIFPPFALKIWYVLCRVIYRTHTFPLKFPSLSLHKTPKLVFFSSPPTAAIPSPHRLFTLHTIHNDFPSHHVAIDWFYFPPKLSTVSSSYPSASTLLSMSCTLSPPWPPGSQRTRSVSFVSGQSKQAASVGVVVRAWW